MKTDCNIAKNNSNSMLCFVRHGRYGSDTFIDRQSMLEAFLQGQKLKKLMKDCETIYHSPLGRACQTAKFLALGLKCNHLIETEKLTENANTFTIKKFVDAVLLSDAQSLSRYCFVTHLPVVEKLGLPDLGCMQMCLCQAQNNQEMLAENFLPSKIDVPDIEDVLQLMRQINLTAAKLNDFGEDDIYRRLSLL